MTEAELQNRIEASPVLSRVREQLAEELVAPLGNAAAFSPLLVIAIISIVVQVIIYCRENSNDADLLAAVRGVNELPLRRRMRLKRRLNQLWREESARLGAPAAKDNPLLSAVYRVAAKLDESAAQELVQLAR
jgi:hypothetical protein